MESGLYARKCNQYASHHKKKARITNEWTRPQDLPIPPAHTVSEKITITGTDNALDDWKRPANEETVVPDANPFAGPGVSNWKQDDVHAVNNKRHNSDERKGASSHWKCSIDALCVFMLGSCYKHDSQLSIPVVSSAPFVCVRVCVCLCMYVQIYITHAHTHTHEMKCKPRLSLTYVRHVSRCYNHASFVHRDKKFPRKRQQAPAGIKCDQNAYATCSKRLMYIYT